MSVTEPDASDGGAPARASAEPDPLAAQAAPAPHHRKKHKAHIQHKTRGRIRMRVPHARVNPEILEAYRETFSAIPGIQSVTTKPDSGSIVIHYDPSREEEFERHFHQASNEHLDMPQEAAHPEDEIDKLATKIEAEAEFLAAHSRAAKASVDFLKSFDRELKLATGNTVDLKIVLAVGLAAYTFLEIGGNAATPMWVTLALFSLHHFAELQTDHREELLRARATMEAEANA
jgi:hypothetical protein